MIIEWPCGVTTIIGKEPRGKAPPSQAMFNDHLIDCNSMECALAAFASEADKEGA